MTINQHNDENNDQTSQQKETGSNI